MTYTELNERIWDLDVYRAYTGIHNVGPEVERRIEAIEDPAERTAYRIIRMLLGRKGFQYWWDPDTYEGMPAECNDEIFEEMKTIIRNQSRTTQH
jgi:hypothetical protein